MSVENTSGLHPLGRAVLVQMVELEDLKTTMIHVPDTVRRQASYMEQRALVVEVGAAAWEDESAPRAQPGDRVLVTRMAGFIANGPKDGKLYRLVNDRDIFCRIEEAS